MSNPGAVGSFQRLAQPGDDRVELLCQIVVGVHSQVGLGVFDLVDVEGALVWPPGPVTNSILFCGLFTIKDQC